ncbi:unnamed protein product [Urochloa decumbens]|uniref:F-box domain-containing protein n=1 Tax=Urochloa decumbens TaxID=240449 RepID=A0ABC9G6T1_9POAL
MESALVRTAKRRRELHAAPLAATGNDGVLPTDILHEVLLRLPANVLCRLRLVCWSWRSLTSDPIFARAHFSRHPLIVGLYNDASCREVQFVDLSGSIVKQICLTGGWDYGYNVSAMPSLLCTRTTNEGCVLNPSTGAFTVLPANIEAEHQNKSSPILSLSLLGRIPSTGVYKVLRIHRYLMGSDPLQTCEVMTVGDVRWMARACPPVTVAATPLHAVIVNGVAYFLLEVHHPGYVKMGDIALFDLATEEWRSDTLQGPPKGLLPIVDEKTRICLHLTKLNGCLVTICRCSTRGHHYKDESMDLWFLVDMDKGQWTKMYSFQCRPVLEYGLRSPLEVLSDGRILIWVDCVRCLWGI